MAGFLARGSAYYRPSQPIGPVASSVSLTAYSCGGSHGIGLWCIGRTVFPINPPLGGTIDNTMR